MTDSPEVETARLKAMDAYDKTPMIDEPLSPESFKAAYDYHASGQVDSSPESRAARPPQAWQDGTKYPTLRAFVDADPFNLAVPILRHVGDFLLDLRLDFSSVADPNEYPPQEYNFRNTFRVDMSQVLDPHSIQSPIDVMAAVYGESIASEVRKRSNFPRENGPEWLREGPTHLRLPALPAVHKMGYDASVYPEQKIYLLVFQWTFRLLRVVTS